MKDLFHGFWHGLQSRGKGFDWSANCLGTLGLTIVLSQRLWDEWVSTLHGPFFVEKACLYLLALMAFFCYEGWYLVRHLRRTGRSGWWVIPLMLFLVGLAGPPQWGHPAHVYFAIAFMVLELLLFIDLYFMRRERS
jgi:uncharacterized membrane protein YhaH (DUF805 family)